MRVTMTQQPPHRDPKSDTEFDLLSLRRFSSSEVPLGSRQVLVQKIRNVPPAGPYWPSVELAVRRHAPFLVQRERLTVATAAHGFVNYC